jgi:hypothetical protein
MKFSVTFVGYMDKKESAGPMLFWQLYLLNFENLKYGIKTLAARRYSCFDKSYRLFIFF